MCVVLCGVAGSLLKRVIRLLGVRPCLSSVRVRLAGGVLIFVSIWLGGQPQNQNGTPHRRAMKLERSEGFRDQSVARATCTDA